ncbi:MFS siderochrome iron transporter 1 [Endocarpon pusillum]|uniref:MFS siderochrome iron transporter 1 n=1 Tax=Endocarpon pusillum TaxID=364733 RepID=A0A8H7AB64_9EURO|nr:MFS siderochrome iron transporter 1 [Endocarpon pusillum]
MSISEESSTKDLESQKTNTTPETVSHWRLVRDHALLTTAVLHYPYRGSGTEQDPYQVEFIPHDPRNPMAFPAWKKWGITIVMAIATLAVAFVSSAYSGGIRGILMEFKASQEVGILGISLFVLGFAIGPLLWAPMSELYGRQILFIVTYNVLTIFNAGAAGANNMAALVAMRLLAGLFGSSPLTNAGGVIADMFTAEERGLATSLFAAAPFLGPALGPIVGGFVGQNIGWRWIEGIMAIFTGVLAIIGGLLVPETYAPVLLRKRAAALSERTGKVYISMLDKKRGPVSPRKSFETALIRPWILLFREPIVLLISIYMAIIYGTLYMLFAAFPIVFQEVRGWSEGIGGLSFLGVMVGMMIGVAYSIWDNRRYVKISKAAAAAGRLAPPESRLVLAMPGAIALPVGMFWFAWTNYPSIHWSVCIIGTAPFGFGMVLVFLSQMNYLIDSYTIYAASVLAANSVLRSLFGAAFPLFTTQMYMNLGIHWASSIPAFLALACLPFPFLFYKYGEQIRLRCKYAAKAAEIMKDVRQAERDAEERNDERRVQAEKRRGEARD